MDLVLQIYTRSGSYIIPSHRRSELERSRQDALEILGMPQVMRVQVRAGRGGEVLFDTEEMNDTEEEDS